MLSPLIYFGVCSKNLYIWSSGTYIKGLEHNLKLNSVCELI